MSIIDESPGWAPDDQTVAPATTARHPYVTAAEHWASLTQAPQFNRPTGLSPAPTRDSEELSESRLSVLIEEQTDMGDAADSPEEASERSDVTAALYNAQLRAIAQQDD